MKFCFIILLSFFASDALSARPEPGLKMNSVKVEAQASGLVIHTKAPGRLQFYLFDVEGRLVHKSEINSERQGVHGLDKGTYFYSIFNQDIEIYSGKIIVKD